MSQRRMVIEQIDPKLIRFTRLPSRLDIVYQASRLENEGQIEPFVVALINGSFYPNVNHDEFFEYTEAAIQAACWLGWPTVLITYTPVETGGKS